MALPNKQIRLIKKSYPEKPVQVIAAELGVSPSQVYRVLGLNRELWAARLETAAGYLLCCGIAASPLMFLRGISNFADLPQRVFVQAFVPVLALLWVALRRTRESVAVVRHPLGITVILFMVWACAGMLWAQCGYDSFYSAVHWCACAVVFFVLCSVLSEKWVEKILVSVCSAAALTVVLGLLQHWGGVAWVPVRAAPAAVFANANMASQYVVMVLPVVCAAGFRVNGKSLRVSLWGMTLLGLVFLYYTGCRAAWLAAGAALCWAVLLMLSGLAAGRKKEHVFLLSLAIVFAVSAVSAFLVKNRVVNTLGGSAVYRQTVWQNTLAMIKDRPFRGFGPGHFSVVYPAYTSRSQLDRAFDKEKQIRRAHNDYLQCGAELGLPGLVLFTALPLSGLIIGFRKSMTKPPFSRFVLLTGFSAGIVSFMVTAFFSFPFQRSQPPLLLFVYLGALMLVCRGKEGPVSWCNAHRLRAGTTAIACVVIVAAGFFLARFNINNLICDRYFLIAMSMEKRGANQRALAAARIAHEKNPYRMDVLSTLGRACITTGKTKQGIEALKKATAGHPYHLNALFILGVGYANAGMNKEALETFKKVLRIKPDFPEAKKIIATIKSRGRASVNLS